MQPSQASTETNLPRAVRAQMARIDARRQARPGSEAEGVDLAAGDAPGAAQAAAPAIPPATPGDSQGVDPRETDPGYWRQRFQVTSGLLSKERTDSKARNDDLYRQISDLTSQVQTLQAKAQPADDAVDIAKFYTPEQIATYGEEQCKVMAATALRAAKSEAQALIDAAVQPLKQRAEQDKADEATRRKQAFVDALIAAQPDYETIDKDPRWQLWLAETDPDTELQRQEMLNAHVQGGNARAVAKMMKLWEKSVALPAPPAAPSGSGAAPAGGDAPPTADPGLTAPTDVEVKDFYKRSAIGKVKDDERTRFETRLRLRNRASA